jgi:uncharacterized protein involved in exopolysaccharide biosynthesis
MGTQAEILGSPAVISAAVERIQWPVAPQPGISPVAMLKERISVRPVMGTNVLSVSLQADNAERAVQAIHALVESYENYTRLSEQDAHVEVLNLLAKNEKEVRADLQMLEEEYRQLRGRSPLIASFKNGVDVQLAHVDQLGRKLAEMRGRRVELENQVRIASSEFSKAQITVAGATQGYVNAHLVLAAHSPAHHGNVPVPVEAPLGAPRLSPQSLVGANLPGARDIAAIQNQLVQARVLQSELHSRYGHRHPEVRAVAEQIASLVSEEQKALQAGHELLRRELETVTANEKQLSELCEAELSRTKVLDSYHLEEQQMISRVTRVQSVHDSIVDQLRQWKLSGEMASDGRSPIRVSILESPVAPLKPVWPSARILLGLCAAVGMVSGFGLIAFLEQRSRDIRRTLPASELVVTHLSRPVMPGV